MQTLKDYWRARWAERTYTLVLLTMFLLFTVSAIVIANKALAVLFLGNLLGVIGMAVLNVITFGQRVRNMMLGLVIASLFATQVHAQSLDFPPTPPQPLPGYVFDYRDSITIMLPDGNNDPEHIGIIPIAICVGIAVGIIGYVGVKIISACLKNHEFVVTNNAACGVCPAESPIEGGDPVPTGHSQYDNCDCDSPNSPPVADQPLPVDIQHSFDRDHWETVSHGMAISQELTLPDTGYWRMVPLRIRSEIVEGGVILHVPPGVLEHSDDLRTWDVLSSSWSDQDIVAGEGFYRVRMN